MLTALAALFLAAHPAAAKVDKAAVLADMQNRGIIPVTQTSWSDPEWTLLWKIKKAEGEGAIDYLVGRVRKIQPYVAVVRREDGSQKFLLTPAGYERYHFFKSQDAIREFEVRGIQLKDIFHLTDMKGRHFFDSTGLLTDHGEAAYDAIRRGDVPRWKFDWEASREKSRRSR